MTEEKNINKTEQAIPQSFTTYEHDGTVFKVGCYFSSSGKETLKDILERSIRRDAKAKMKG